MSDLDLMSEAALEALADLLVADGGSRDITPRTRDELHEYVTKHYGYTIPNTPVCKGHCSPFDALADAFFDARIDADGNEVKDLDTIWIGPRTGGKTLQFAILDHLVLYHFGDTVANVGAIDAQALKCYGYFEDFATRPTFRHALQKDPMLSRTYMLNGGMLEVLPATRNRLNSPHPRRAHWDEIELTTDLMLQEGASMPVRTKGRPPAAIYTSSRKKAKGPMERMLREARETGNRSIKTWCVMEIIERCPEERHQQGVGCQTCPLALGPNGEGLCRETQVDEYGASSLVPGPGRAARANGWMVIDDVIQKFKSMAWGVFKAQWLSQKPSTEGLAYPDFDEDIHVIDYVYNPAFPVVCGIDFGYVNPSVALYAQPLQNGGIVIFAEDYKRLRTAEVFATSIKREPWFSNTRWRVADSADPGDANTLRAHGVPNEPANKAGTAEEPSSVIAGINLCRWLMKPLGRPAPILYIARTCVNTIEEIETYSHPEAKEHKNLDEAPEKKDDHAMDAMRYMMTRLYRGGAVV